MMLTCSKIKAGLWNDAKKATCRLRIFVASCTNRSGKPSAKFLLWGQVVWGVLDASMGWQGSAAAAHNAKKHSHLSPPADPAQLDLAARRRDLQRQLLRVGRVEEDAVLLHVVRDLRGVDVGGDAVVVER